MNRKTVLIISEHPADFYSLSAALQRAQPARFQPVTVNTRDQPVDALMDPANDVVILAYTLETEYLLRLAQKKNLAVPIIVLIDQASEAQLDKLKEAGASDYIVRGLVSDDILHRILDYNMVLKHLSVQHEQVLEQQKIERVAQQAGERLRSVAQAAGDAGTVSAETGLLRGGSTVGPGSPRGSTVRTGQAPPAEARLSRTLSSPWKASVLAIVAALLVMSAVLFSQRLDNESRLSRLEAGNDLLAQQVTQIHSDMTRMAPVPRVENPFEKRDVTAQLPAALPAVPQVPLPGSRESYPASTPRQISPVEAAPAAVDDESNAIAPVIRIPAEQSGSWFVNLGTFSSRSAAQRFAGELGSTSHRLQVIPVLVAGRELYRVRLVDLPSAEEAEALAIDYQLTLGGSRPWVGTE